MRLLIAVFLLASTPAFAHEAYPAATKPAAQKVAKPAKAAVVRPAKPSHSGGTDAYGCHTNHTTGDYHCHNPK